MAEPTFTSYGYAGADGTGTIAPNEVWAAMSGWGGGRRYWVRDADMLAVAPLTGGTREVTVSGGWAGGAGVLDKVGDGTSTSAGTVQIATADPTVPTWYLLCVARGFSTVQASSWKVIVAGASAVVPARDVLELSGASPSVAADDQPVALVQLTPGNSVPTAVVDLRLVGTGGEYVAYDKLVLSYIAWPGVRVRIGTDVWVHDGAGWELEPAPFHTSDLAGLRSTNFGNSVAGWTTAKTEGQSWAQADGNRIVIQLFSRRSGATISPNAHGSIPDQTVYTLSGPWRPDPGVLVPFVFLYRTATGNATGTGYVDDGGNIKIAQLTGGEDLSTTAEGFNSVQIYVEFTKVK